MGDTPGGEVRYFRRYTLADLVAMGFADSAEAAEANAAQWRRLGELLLGAAESGTKVARNLPEVYRSREGAPALLERLGETSKLLQDYGQIALDNGTAWSAVKDSLGKAQAQLAALQQFGAHGMEHSARDAAADVVEKLSADYINHANEILPLDPTGDTHDDNTGGGTETTFVTRDVAGGPGAGGPPVHADTGGDRGMWTMPGPIPSATPGPASGSPAPGSTSGHPAGFSDHRAASDSRAGAGSNPAWSRSGGSPGVIGGPPSGGVGTVPSYAPVSVTPRSGTPSGPPGAGPSLAGDGSRGGSVPRSGVPSMPPTAGSPHSGDGRRGRKARGRRRGGLLGDPNDFRFDADVVAPPEIQPDEHKPVTEIGKTIGGGRKPAGVRTPAHPAQIETPQAEPSPAPLFDADILPAEDEAQFRLRRRSGA